MLNLQICTVIIMTKKHKNINKKIKKKKPCSSRDSDPGHMGSKSSMISTTPWGPVRTTDKNNQYKLKL